MKKFRLTFLVLAFACLTLGTALAEGPRRLMTVDVPFNFLIGTSAFAAGQYNIYGSDGHHLMWIQDSDGKWLLVTGTIPSSNNKFAEKPALVFNRYGDTYFLSKVVTAGESIASYLVKSKREREVARVAANPATSKILVAQAPEK